jgi:hypothetical protein
LRGAVELMAAASIARIIRVDPDRVLRDELRRRLAEGFRAGLTLPTVLRALTAAQGVVGQSLLRGVSERVPLASHSVVVRQVMDAMLEAHQHVADEVLELSEVAHAVHDGGARDPSFVHRLMVGGISAEEFQRVTKYQLAGVHVAAVAFSRLSGPDRLRKQAERALRGMGCVQIFDVVVAPTVLWAWGYVPTAEGLRLAPPDPCQYATVTVGLPGQGLAGFAASHDEARALQRMIALSDGRNLGRSLTYREYGAVAELAEHPNRLRRFLTEQLGSLAVDNPKTRDLRATALEYLNTNRSQIETARRLYVSKNTVGYRLHRVEELLGRNIGTDISQLHVALLAAEVLGVSAAA